MAVAMIHLLENLSRLLISDADLISGAEDELRCLIKELVLLIEFLQDAATKAKKDKKFREMEREIKELAHDAEDTIDACLADLTATKDYKNILRRRRVDLMNPTPPVNLEQEVRSIREDKLRPVLDKVLSIEFGDGMQIGSGLSRVEQIAKVQKLPSIKPDSIVGLEDEEHKIVNYLMEEREELDVVTIVGMPGLGKTTMAWKVYHSHQIMYEFPIRIWVYVSQEFNRKTLFLNILQRFTRKDLSSESVHGFALAVRACLQEIKFLLVLDDVWTAEAWDAIRDALPRSNRLRFLTEDECWELLNLKAVEELREFPRNLQQFRQQISEQCSGLPILVLMIAGNLVDLLSKSPETFDITNAWEEFSKRLNSNTVDRAETASSILESSYDRLPDELRDCFLYLGVFPEDYEIPVWTLTQLWVAEGFIQPNEQGQSLEETAEENLNYFINENLVMVDKLKADGKVKTCRVHEMVRGFCITESRRKENLFQELKKDRDIGFGPQLQKHRRICIHSNVSDFFSREPYFPHVRSFLTFYKEELTLQTEDIPKIPAAFELIRVLHIKSIRFRIFPLQLAQLVYLKYIVLTGDFKVLPEVVSMLQNTLTLVIQTSSPTLVVKADIWKMIQLRHVKTNASMVLLKKPKDNEGKNLQTLANISPGNCTIGLFEQMLYLKKLGIRGTLSTLLDGEVGSSSKFDSLRILMNLENLKLMNNIHTVSPLPSLPRPDTFRPRLRILTLSATFLSWHHMSVLGNLENLEVLKLKDKAFVGECWEVAGGGFRRLQFLSIEYTNLVYLKLAFGSDDHFPRLRFFRLKNCEKLIALPGGMANIHTLESMDLFRTNKIVADSARKIQHEMSSRRLKLSIFPPDGGDSIPTRSS
ncbi:hypothetical protein CASFOL_032433 [Castilleja foliolosa]|uniref:Uncharacterized protein n=1 Tax=Castilleja foliolosa TaxID=1961234 RepID=A0ABD3C229_9LAMI